MTTTSVELMGVLRAWWGVPNGVGVELPVGRLMVLLLVFVGRHCRRVCELLVVPHSTRILSVNRLLHQHHHYPLEYYGDCYLSLIPLNMIEDERDKKKTSRPGRSSRRRKRKAQSILEAATLSLESSSSNVAQVANQDAAPPTDASAASVVPIDRGFTLEGVRYRRREEHVKRSHNVRRRDNGCQQKLQKDESNDTKDTLDPTDEYQLKSQLGFVPGNAVCVAARLSKEFYCTNNQHKEAPPSVVQLYPMAVRQAYEGGKSDGRKFKGRRRGAMRTDNNDEDFANANVSESTKPKKERGWFIESSSATQNDSSTQQPRQIIEPFPTLYWLTSPILRSHISKIELSKTNGVPQMEARLRSKREYLNQMKRAHKSYGKQRWELLTDGDREEALLRGWGGALGDERGVAGIRPKKGGGDGRWDSVKCLHAHSAHFLAQVEEWRHEREWKKSAAKEEEEDKGNNNDESLRSLMADCNRDDLNLVGQWTIEAVLDELV